MTTFGFPTQINFGAGIRKDLPEFLKAKKIIRPLLVTDKGLAELPICALMEKLLKDGGLKVATFSGAWGNPVKSQVEAGLAAFKSHQADGIVGMGGGAALDVSKAITLLANHPGDLFDYECFNPHAKSIDKEVPPWIAVPTTSGTGSEVGRSAVISDETTRVKKFLFSPKFLAQAIFADPELTLDLPPKVTAATGMDALTHCVEAYLAKDFHPICDGIALEGARLASQSLEKAVKQPHNVEARGLMMMVSIMGGIAFQKDLGLTHSCAHALGTAVDMHHGLANAVMIDHALKFNVPVREERFKNLAVAVGAQAQSAQGFLKWLSQLKVEIGMPKNLTEAGVSRSKIDELSKLAFADSCHQYNPRPVSEADFKKIFSEAF
jgi:alcohol dehydrogenase class IV